MKKIIGMLLLCIFTLQAQAKETDPTEDTRIKEVITQFLAALKKKQLGDAFPLYSSPLQLANTCDNLLLLSLDAGGTNPNVEAKPARDILNRYFREADAAAEIAKLNNPISNGQKLILQSRFITDPKAFNDAARAHLKSDELLPDCVAVTDDFKIKIDGNTAKAYAWDGLYLNLLKEDGKWRIDTDLAYRGAAKRP